MQHLNDYSFDRLRLAVPIWSNSTLYELLGKIKVTLKDYSDIMNDDERNSLIRKWAIVRHELYKRIKNSTKLTNMETHRLQEKIIWNTREVGLEENDWRKKK